MKIRKILLAILESILEKRFFLDFGSNPGKCLPQNQFYLKIKFLSMFLLKRFFFFTNIFISDISKICRLFLKDQLSLYQNKKRNGFINKNLSIKFLGLHSCFYFNVTLIHSKHLWKSTSVALQGVNKPFNSNYIDQKKVKWTF